MNTYDPTLPTDVDWVRFLIGDTSQEPVFHDEEIQAFLDMNTTEYGTGIWNRYFTAADVLGALAQRWRMKAGDVSSKSVSRLSISYGGSRQGLDQQASAFRRKGADLLYPRPKLFKAISLTCDADEA